MTALDRRTYTAAEVAELERATGLDLYGYLYAPPTLLPILGAPGRPQAERRALVARLNRAGLPVSPDLPQVEAEQLPGDAGDGSRRRAAGD